MSKICHLFKSGRPILLCFALSIKCISLASASKKDQNMLWLEQTHEKNNSSTHVRKLSKEGQEEYDRNFFNVFAQHEESIIFHIFSFLHPKEIFRNSVVCSKWEDIAIDEVFWKFYANKHYPSLTLVHRIGEGKEEDDDDDEQDPTYYRGVVEEIIKEREDLSPSSSLEILHKVCQKKRGISIQTDRLVITPFFPGEVNSYVSLFKKLIKKGQDRYFPNSRNIEKEIPLLRKESSEYCKASLAEKEKLKLVRYSIYALNKQELPEFIGIYTITPPKESMSNQLFLEYREIDKKDLSKENALADVTIIIKPEYQRKGFGLEITNEICKQLITPMIGSQWYYYKRELVTPMNALELLDALLNTPEEGLDDNNEYQIVLYQSQIPLEGLKAEVDADNIASQKMHEKAGWQCVEKVYKQNKEMMIYRYPPLESEGNRHGFLNSENKEKKRKRRVLK